jgi:hypothetical protein
MCFGSTGRRRESEQLVIDNGPATPFILSGFRKVPVELEVDLGFMLPRRREVDG